ncbi:MAG: sigma-70 family RNA polymerase sigma factor [Clostridia bacterium]
MNDEREQFFEEAYAHYRKKMEKVCLEYVDYREEYRDLIDESIQETYLIAVKKYDELLNHAALEGWFVKTCYNRFTTAVRKYRRHKSCHAFSIDDEDNAPQVAQTISALDVWLKNENADAYAKKVIEILNKREAEIFRERFVEGKKIPDIAKRQHSTISAIKSILSRVKKKMQNLKDTDFSIFIFIFASFAFLVRLMK